MSERQCTECGRPVSDWPMSFRGDDQCSVLCQKAARNRPVPEELPVTVMAPESTMTADW